MKKILALLLAASFMIALTSCSLIRKATDPSEQPSVQPAANDDDKPTDTGKKELTASEAEALIKENASDVTSVSATGKIVAENDGTEYYIFEVTEGDRRSLRYVSKAGDIRGALSSGNVDTAYAESAFKNKYGEENAKTGGKYKLVYEGLLKSGETYCYSFAVYEVAGDRESYSFNFLVTVDGKMSAETKIDH